MSPEVRVVRGEPDDVELAALVAGLAAGTVTISGPSPDGAHTAHAFAADAAAEAAARRRWREAALPLSHPLVPGVDAWRWSAR